MVTHLTLASIPFCKAVKTDMPESSELVMEVGRSSVCCKNLIVFVLIEKMNVSCLAYR
jgi:hypothetical protein